MLICKLVCVVGFNVPITSEVPSFRIVHLQWRTQEKNSGGAQVYGWPRRGSGGGAPRTPENLRKFANTFLKKIEKMHYFSIFFKKFNKFQKIS